MKIDKITATKHQLDTAIELFFLDRDPISIRTLLSSAWSVLYNLHCKQGSESSRDWIAASFANYTPKEIGTILNRDWNFFKHARDDAEEILEFDASVNEELLMFAVNDFAQLTNNTTFPMEIYQLWFISKNENIFKDVKQAHLFELSNSVFPNLAISTVAQQKRVGCAALSDTELYNQHIEGKYLLPG